MKYEIINPSDEATIEGESFREVCIATIILGEGKYGLEPESKDIKFHMPPVIFAKEWFEKTFSQTLSEAIREINIFDLKRIFKTVRLVNERTSLNDIEGYAKILVSEIEDRGHA